MKRRATQTAKELTGGNCGSRRNMAAIRRKMTHHAGVAQHKEHDRKGYDQENVERGAPKGRKDGRTRRECGKGPDCNNGIRDRDLRQQLRGAKRIKNLGT
jgi:hypothetical protein